MLSRLLIRPSLLALRCPSVTKGEKLFSNVGGRLHQRSKQIRSTLPSFCKLYTTDLQNNTEAKNDVEKLEEKVERSTSMAEDGQTASRSRAKRKNSRLNKKGTKAASPTEPVKGNENLTPDDQLLQQIKTIKANPQAVLRAFNAMKNKPIQAYTLAIKAYIDINSLVAALDLWHTMEKDPNVKLNTMAYNKLMHIHYEMHQYKKMIEVYHHIAQNHKPNIETFHRLIMMATSPEVDSVEQVNWIASEMVKYSSGDFFLIYELFKFYAGHDMWEEADKYTTAMKNQKSLPPVLPSLLKVINLLKTVKTNSTASEEIKAQWDEFNKSIKLREIGYYGRLLNELLTTEILEYFLKHDDTRAHEVIERITLIMRDSDARATAMRQLVTTAQKAYRLDILQDFEQCLVKHKRQGVLADLGFTYAYNGLTDNLRQFIESSLSDGLIMSQLHHILRGVLWHNTASKNRRYFMVPKEGFDTPEQHLKNTEAAQEVIGLLNKKFGFEPTIETKTLIALAYIKARSNDRAREILADVNPEQSSGFNLYKKTMKYLNKSKDRVPGAMPNNFWREVSAVIDNQDCDQLKKIFAENHVSNFSPSLLQRSVLCFEKFRLIDDAIDLCTKIMLDYRDKLDVQLCKNIVRLAFTYKRQELGEQALELFRTGPWQPARLDFRVTNIVLNFYIFTKQLAKAEEFFQYCIKEGSVIRPYTFGRLLSQVLAQGRLRDAWIYFIQQRTCPLGPRSVDNNGYSTLTTMLIYNKLTPYAVALFDSMKEDCVLPDRFVYKQFCDMIFGRNQFKDDTVQVLDASGQQVPPPEQAVDTPETNVSSDVKQSTTGESIATIHSSQKSLPKLLALMQLPLEGLPEHSDFKLRVAKPTTVRTPKM